MMTNLLCVTTGTAAAVDGDECQYLVLTCATTCATTITSTASSAADVTTETPAAATATAQHKGNDIRNCSRWCCAKVHMSVVVHICSSVSQWQS